MDAIPQLRMPMDPGRIHRLDPGDMQVWADEFGCPVELLDAVIDEVGDHPTAVRAALERRGGIARRAGGTG